MKDYDFDCKDKDCERLQIIEDKLTKLSTDVEELVMAWKAAGWLVSFIKWLGGIATAITSIYLLYKMR